MEPLTPTITREDTTTISKDTSGAVRVDTIAWWELEAQRTLQNTTSFTDVQLICHYVPFSDGHAASRALSEQRRSQLLRLSLAAHKAKPGPGRQIDLTADGKVHATDIMQLLSVEQEPSPLSRAWTPPSANSSVKLPQIVTSLNSHFRSLFHGVCLNDWIKAAFGYGTAAITSIYQECVDTRVLLYGWYADVGLSIEEQDLVEKGLRSHNPLAHWIVSQSVAPPREALRPFFHGFEVLSAGHAGDFMCWVRQLAVLAERFQQHICATDIDWKKDLLSGSVMLHQISCEDLGAIAGDIRDEDFAMFRALNNNNFFASIENFQTRWQNLSDTARACARADRDTGERISELAKRLHDMQDYQAMTALLDGLRQTNVRSSAISLTFVNPDDNYAAYRALWAQKQSIPFLRPHVKEIQHAEDPCRKVDEFLGSYSPQRQASNQSGQATISNQEPNQLEPARVYSHVKSEAPPKFSRGHCRFLNVFRCFW